MVVMVEVGRSLRTEGHREPGKQKIMVKVGHNKIKAQEMCDTKTKDWVEELMDFSSGSDKEVALGRFALWPNGSASDQENDVAWNYLQQRHLTETQIAEEELCTVTLGSPPTLVNNSDAL